MREYDFIIMLGQREIKSNNIISFSIVLFALSSIMNFINNFISPKRVKCLARTLFSCSYLDIYKFQAFLKNRQNKQSRMTMKVQSKQK